MGGFSGVQCVCLDVGVCLRGSASAVRETTEAVMWPTNPPLLPSLSAQFRSTNQNAGNHYAPPTRVLARSVFTRLGAWCERDCMTQIHTKPDLHERSAHRLEEHRCDSKHPCQKFCQIYCQHKIYEQWPAKCSTAFNQCFGFNTSPALSTASCGLPDINFHLLVCKSKQNLHLL